jgi:heme O synthase-like polyprenyltransferase
MGNLWANIKTLMLTLGILAVSLFSVIILPTLLSIIVIILGIMLGAVFIFMSIKLDRENAKKSNQ